MKKTVFLMQGCSGSGKSTWITSFKRRFDNLFREKLTLYGKSTICSANNYFIRPDGVYSWNPKDLIYAHSWCFYTFCRAIFEKLPVIFVDNTNTQLKDYEKYIKEAELYGYRVKIIKIGKLDDESLKLYASRNNHGVPYSTIVKQAERLKELWKNE